MNMAEMSRVSREIDKISTRIEAIRKDCDSIPILLIQKRLLAEYLQELTGGHDAETNFMVATLEIETELNELTQRYTRSKQTYDMAIGHYADLGRGWWNTDVLDLIRTVSV